MSETRISDERFPKPLIFEPKLPLTETTEILLLDLDDIALHEGLWRLIGSFVYATPRYYRNDHEYCCFFVHRYHLQPSLESVSKLSYVVVRRYMTSPESHAKHMSCIRELKTKFHNQ